MHRAWLVGIPTPTVPAAQVALLRLKDRWAKIPILCYVRQSAIPCLLCTTIPVPGTPTCRSPILGIPPVAITIVYRYPVWAGATILWSRPVSRPAVPIITLPGITLSGFAYRPFPPVDNYLLSTQHPSAVPIIRLPGITLSDVHPGNGIQV
jgi:hypothetical protein